MVGTIWLMLWALFLGFVAGYRYGSGRTSMDLASVFGLGNGPSQSPVASESQSKVTDPVCGELVSANRAKPSVQEGRVYYFCSRECREIFEAAPSLYIYGAGTNGLSRRKEGLDGQSMHE